MKATWILQLTVLVALFASGCATISKKHVSKKKKAEPNYSLYNNHKLNEGLLQRGQKNMDPDPV